MDLNALNDGDLRDFAESVGVPGPDAMGRVSLIEAIQARATEPGKSNFVTPRVPR